MESRASSPREMSGLQLAGESACLSVSCHFDACQDGSPHVMPVWGLWLDEAFYFSTGSKSRKAKNLAKNPRCVICSDDSAEAVIVEGEVEYVRDSATLEPIFKAYTAKYRMDISGMGEPFYRVRPRVAFGLYEKRFGQTATRWSFLQ